MKRSYSFLLLLISLSFVTISLSALNTRVPLWLVHNHFSVSQIGLVGSSYFLGNLVGSIIANWLIKKFNVRHTYTYICILFAISTLGLSFSMGLYSWAFWRFFIGIACAITWVLVESCILLTGTVRTRGKMLAVYMVTYYLGTVIGQTLLRYFPENVLYFGLIILIFMGLAILFVLLTHYKLPKRKSNSFNIMPMLLHKEARLGLIGCLVSGMIMGALYALLPAYYSRTGYSDTDVANWMALLIFSGVIAQIPANWSVDKYGRSRTLLIESLLLIIASFILFLGWFEILPIMILGATTYTIYPLSMAWACARVKKNEIVPMNQAMMLTNIVGSLIAPAVISVLMGTLGNNFLFMSLVMMTLYFVVLLIRRRKAQ